MNKIFSQLEQIKKEHRMGIMTHIVLGYPSIEESKKLVRAMAKVGVDFVELQIPFSDPLGDGPTIMKANHAALQAGIKVADAFDAAKELSHNLNVPLLYMTYYQILFRYGVERFCKDAAAAGVSGLIIPDIPVDEERHDHFFQHARAAGLVPMKFLSMVSTDERVRQVVEQGDFLYFFGQKGTTGAKSTLHEDLAHHFHRIRNIMNVPTAVGFGISKPEHIRELKAIGANVAIIGSAVLNVFNEAQEGKKVEAIGTYVKTLVEAAR